jgi:hypothetical protein
MMWDDLPAKDDMDPVAALCTAAVACSVMVQTTPHTRPMPPPAKVQTVAIKPVPNALNILPPAIFDKPYDGTTVIVRAASKAHLRLMCNNNKTNNKLGIGCALLYPETKTCRIVVAPEADIIAAGYTERLVIRHERGHCNSWSGKHEGSRMASDSDR